MLIGLCYSGICTTFSKNVECHTTTGRTADKFASKFSGLDSESIAEATPLFSLALVLQTKIMLCLLASAGVLFLFGILFLGLLKRNMKSGPTLHGVKRARRMQIALYSSVWMSVAVAFASAASIDQTTSALRFTTNSVSGSAFLIHTGTTLPVLQWLIVGFSATFALGLSRIVKTVGGTIQAGGIEMGNSNPPPLPPLPPPPM
jgi:hypothetical protein